MVAIVSCELQLWNWKWVEITTFTFYKLWGVLPSALQSSSWTPEKRKSCFKKPPAPIAAWSWESGSLATLGIRILGNPHASEGAETKTLRVRRHYAPVWEPRHGIWQWPSNYSPRAGYSPPSCLSSLQSPLPLVAHLPPSQGSWHGCINYKWGLGIWFWLLPI